MTIELDGLTPQGIDARGIALDLVGSAPALALAVSGWAKDHPRLLKVPARASAVAVSWRAAARDEPWLVVRDATIEPVGPGGRFSAAGVHLLGKPIGQIGASWGGDTSTVTLGFGEADAERAPVRIDVRHAASEPEAVLILHPTALERLAGPLGVELPVKGVTASARAEMKFVGPGTKGAVVGKLTVELDGYRPPVPSELSALTFGSSTHFEAELEVSADRGRIDLRGVKVEHGAFRLAGQGAVTRQPDHALVSFALEGHLACADLARTIARSKIGGQTGRLAGIAAGLAVKGSVSIGVAIELDSRHFADAAVHPKIGIGCGLADFGSLTRDLHLPRLPSLGR